LRVKLYLKDPSFASILFYFAAALESFENDVSSLQALVKRVKVSVCCKFRGKILSLKEALEICGRVINKDKERGLPYGARYC